MPPDFDDLVGTDLEAGDRARLERVHDLLVAAGPPPEPAARVIPFRPRRRRGALLAVAAALAVAAFAFGAAIGNQGQGREVYSHVAMSGAGATANASATLTLFDVDAAGNWPMEVHVRGLVHPASGRHYELWLTRKGKLAALCGTFLTTEAGTASVPMNAPYRFTDFDGWVVVEDGTTTPLLTT